MTKELDLTNIDQITDFLDNNRNKEIPEYAKEFNGNRQIRKLQIGHRKDFQQGVMKVEAERLTVNFQRKIVDTAVSFLFGEAPDITTNNPEDAASDNFLNHLKNIRLHSKLVEFAENVMSETMGVLIFSIEEDKVKARSFNSSNGIFTPKFDPYGDLKAFFWEFKIDGIDYLWVFDDSHLYIYSGEGEYVFDEAGEHGFDVIPVVFLEQKKPEWWDVKELIDRVEMIISKLAGSNNYFAYPILKLKGRTIESEDGKEESLIDQAEDGKALFLGVAEKNGQVIEAEAEFLQRDTGVESIKLEMDYLKEFIYSISQTPNLSFDNVKGIGAISGRALLLMLQDAINKAKKKQIEYRTVIQRTINVIKSGMKTTDPDANTEELDFTINFNLSLPKDVAEEVRTLLEATGGKPILSQKSGAKRSPLTEDIKKEIEALQEEEATASTRTLAFGDE